MSDAGKAAATYAKETARLREELHDARTFAPPNAAGAHTMAALIEAVKEYRDEATSLRHQLSEAQAAKGSSEAERGLMRVVGDYRQWGNIGTTATTFAAIGAEAITHCDLIARACDRLFDELRASRSPTPTSVPASSRLGDEPRSLLGLTLRTDSTIPPGEVRVEQNGKTVATITNLATPPEARTDGQ